MGACSCSTWIVLCLLAITIVPSAASANTSAEDPYLIHNLVSQGKLENVLAMIASYARKGKSSAIVNSPNAVGFTPLFLAAEPEIADVLIRKGADINFARNSLGWTPLHYAAQQNMPGLVRMLIRHGADLHALSGGRDRVDALSIAAHKHHTIIAKMLVDAGVDPRLSMLTDGRSAYDAMPELQDNYVPFESDNDKKLRNIRKWYAEHGSEL